MTSYVSGRSRDIGAYLIPYWQHTGGLPSHNGRHHFGRRVDDVLRLYWWKLKSSLRDLPKNCLSAMHKPAFHRIVDIAVIFYRIQYGNPSGRGASVIPNIWISPLLSLLYTFPVVSPKMKYLHALLLLICTNARISPVTSSDLSESSREQQKLSGVTVNIKSNKFYNKFSAHLHSTIYPSAEVNILKNHFWKVFITH